MDLTPRARNVLRAFEEARNFAPGFLLSCGVLPEVSESATESLHRVIHSLAGRRFDRRRRVRTLDQALRRIAHSERGFDRVEAEITGLVASETTVAYLFGVAVGLALGAFPSRVRV